MLGFEKFGKKKETARAEVVGPQETSPEVIELLEAKIRGALDQTPDMTGVLTEQDIFMVANHLALMQEQQGGPYTAESLAAQGDELQESIAASLQDRLSAKANTTGSSYRVVNNQGFVVGESDSRAELSNIVSEERQEQDRA